MKVTAEYIAKIAAEAAAKVAASVAIETYENQKTKEVGKLTDRRLHNTKLLLKNYRAFVDHVKYAISDIRQANDESVASLVDLMEGREDRTISIESIKRTTAKTATIISHINEMLNVYRVICESSGNLEDLRRYRVIWALYIDEAPMSISELAESENVAERTIYRDRDMAIERLAALFFGIDGAKA